MSDRTLSEAGFRALYRRVKNTASWGPADRRGALNYLTPDLVAAAASEVSARRTVLFAAPVKTDVTPDNPEPAVHELTSPGTTARSPGLSFAMDRVTMNVHGNADSHVDALCHVIFDGTLYNGVGADTVTGKGATELSVEAVSSGIVGRGLLLDIPRARHARWVEPGDHVTSDDLIAAETMQGVRIGRGDLLFIRVGHRSRRKALGPWD